VRHQYRRRSHSATESLVTPIQLPKKLSGVSADKSEILDIRNNEPYLQRTDYHGIVMVQLLSLVVTDLAKDASLVQSWFFS
jgi:hypothetical protein